MKKNKNIWSSLVLSIGSILLIYSIDAISQNVLCAIFYGAAIVLILIALLNSKNIRKRNFNIIVHIIGIVLLITSNLLFITSLSNAIRLSLAMIILLSGSFVIINKY